MSLQITVYKHSSAFQELHGEWHTLLKAMSSSYVFQTPEFLETWWKSLGSGELHIITVRGETGELVGIAPLFIHDSPSGERELAFIGCVNVSDYLDFCIDPAQLQAVYDALEQHFKAERAANTWSSMYLCSLPAASPTRAWFTQQFEHSREKQQDVSPKILLPSTWDEYLASLPRKQRHEVRRKLRRLETTEHQFELLEHESAVSEAFETFVALHRASSRDKNDFWDEKHLAFFGTLLPLAARAGWIKLYFLRIQGERVATMLLFDFHQQHLLYNSGFNPNLHAEYSPGMVLIAHTIEQAISAGATQYDFLRGDEEYKFRFGAVSEGVFDLHWPATT